MVNRRHGDALMCLPRTKSRGFTLLELVVVLTLLGIMSAAVLPVFRTTFANLEQNHAVRVLVGAMRYSQERAIVDSIEFRLYLDPENGQYFLMRLEEANVKEKTFNPVSGSQGQRYSLPANMSMKRPRANRERGTDFYYISFYPNGACDDAKIALERRGRRAADIELKGTVSKIKVDIEDIDR